MLYLVKYRVVRRDYPNGYKESDDFRIVIAEDEFEAKQKLKNEIEDHDPYSYSISVSDVEVFPVIK